MKDKIWITGLGVVSSIGMNVKENLDSLRSGSRGIGSMKILESVHRDSMMVGEIPLSDIQMMDMLELERDQYKHYTRTSLIGMLAAREALQSSGIKLSDGIATALVSATTVGGMDKTERELSPGSVDSGFVSTHPCGDSTDKIASFLNLDGYRSTLSTACSSSANAIMHAARLIRHGYVERAIVGGVDALSRFTLNGFNSLMILDPEPCRPFDRKRKGLNLGEGAGYLVLESDRLLKPESKGVLCSLSGYANANDAHHQTASSPEGQGAFDAMRQALLMAGIKPGQIDYINAHGTGTENNDTSEGRALIRVFGNKPPALSSTKALTGHTLGAAAGIEAVFSILALQEGILFPQPGFEQAMDEPAISPLTSLKRDLKMNHVLSNSFGFGGNNSTLIFSKL